MEISPAPMSLCMICSQDKSSNPVAMEPGCCGKWLHLLEIDFICWGIEMPFLLS
jgi:hypothetical protein